MNHPTRHNHTWSDLLARFALELGASHYRSGPLCFALPNGPSIVAELLDDGRALALTVDLEHAPEESRLEEFLSANQFENAQDTGIYAVLKTKNALLFCRRMEDAGQFAYDDLVRELQGFSASAQAARDALPDALQGTAEAPPQDAWADNMETFRHIWTDLAFAQGLASELPKATADGSYILALDGAGYVFVRPDNARGCVVIKTMVALLPLFGDEPAAWLSLLDAHLLGQGTEGAFFAIYADEQELVLWRSLPMANLDGFTLNHAIDSLAHVARHYVDELSLEAVFI
ncbi:MAG: type III secretion system chaperone [Polaromonas sp.]|nr:type III secretion system chaperone [Polaromonas sp.]